MERLVLASNNKNKIREFREIFKDREILSLNDIGYFDEIEETGETFLENALIKASSISKYLKNKNIFCDVIADDSGLCVESLNGEPGVYSARYAGIHGDDTRNRQKLLNELKDKENRKAYFVCNIVLYKPDDNYINVEGRTYGTIADEERGSKTFGYDCLFLSDDLHKTFGEATSLEKNKVSHRARALEKLLEIYK